MAVGLKPLTGGPIMKSATVAEPYYKTNLIRRKAIKYLIFFFFPFAGMYPFKGRLSPNVTEIAATCRIVCVPV